MKVILLSKLRALGDTALLSATLGETRRLHPYDEIHLLVPEQWKDLYAHDPRLTRLWTFDTRLTGFRRLKAFFELASTLRHLDVDISLACHASPTSSWLGFLSHAQVRAHHNHNFFEENKLGNLEIPEKEKLKPFIQRDLAVLQALELKSEQKVNLQAESALFISSEQRNWAKAEIAKRKLQTPVLGLGLGASRATKIWPMAYFAQVSRAWNLKTGGSVVAMVSAKERQFSSEWKKTLASDSFYVADHYAVGEMMAMLSEMSVFLGNDSGPRHLAAALKVPTVTLYGPQDPFECHPYDVKKHPYFFINNLVCRTNTDPEGLHRWCGIRECVVEEHKCMKDLSFEPVLQSCLAFVPAFLRK